MISERVTWLLCFAISHSSNLLALRRVGGCRCAPDIAQGHDIDDNHPANFVLMKIGSLHKELVAAMRRRGVLLRDRSSDPGCDGYVRITIGIGDQVTRGLEALKDSLAEIGWRPAKGFSTGVGDGAREF